MNCKNCDNILRTDFSFCPDCGSKIIRKRLTNKSLIYDVIERYFNLDNTFLKTIWHMVIKPAQVCGGYISGLRKKYLNPVSMLAISLTLSGFIIFLMKKIALENINFDSLSYLQTSSGGSGTKKIMASTMEYSSILFLFYIPVLAIASYLFFNKKEYNLAEHAVIAIYALTSFSIVSAVYSIITLCFQPQLYFDTALLYSLFMVIFCIYVAYRNSKYRLKSLFWRIPMYGLVVLMGYLGISVLTLGLLFLTGEVSGQDFAPK